MRILLVEDDDLLCQILTDHLTTQHYVVDVAADGQTGFDYARSVSYDLIVLDVNLPRLNGIRLCELLRQNRYTVPILLLTARGDSSDKVMGLDAGADDYVVKPCPVEEISARIRALLRRPNRATTPILSWGNLCLDPGTCEVTCDGQQIAVSPKEYSLLELFLRNPQRTFSSSAILEHLWSFEDPPGEETIRSHIKRLRRKLKPFGNDGMIDTVYGMGYRLTPPSASNSSSPPDPPAKTVPESPPTLEKTARQIAQAAWEQFKPSTLERVALLDQAVVALETGELPDAIRQAAGQAAHKLAGSLALFGFPDGTSLARSLEQLLKAPLLLNQVAQFKALVNQMHQLLNQPPIAEEPTISPLPSPPPQCQSPQIWIVDDDSTFTQQLQAEGSLNDLQVTGIATLQEVRSRLADHRPDLILLNPTSPSRTPTDRAALSEIRQQYTGLPVVLLMQQDDFEQRLTGVRWGCDRLIARSMPIPDLLVAVQKLLQQQVTPPIQVLAVDDDPLVLQHLSRCLPAQGINLTVLGTPEAVWPCLQSTPPDLVILDIEMPGINGLELCKVIRSDRTWATLPILFLTACREPEMVQQIYEAGADDYISKPFTESEIVTRIFNRLKRNRLLRQTV